ncbi:MAG: glycine--tRNA ligase [Alphaproteobacteria bacterium]|nr:MAG: glycine--tRNA ligase [Alphaproteobacteria bacterium]
MKDIVALCKRRGFIFPASDIYGGLNGFWDYGPLGVELKNNLRDRWWRDMVIAPPLGPDGTPVNIVGLDSSIIQNPKCWEASGHVGGFNDPMVDCRESKKRYRADHVFVLIPKDGEGHAFAFDQDAEDVEIEKRLKKLSRGKSVADFNKEVLDQVPLDMFSNIIGPDVKTAGTLTEPRQFNMMFHTYVGATASEDNKAYLRPETCAGIFLNFKNVVDSSRVKVPFGIAQIGKAFRNEVTPRNFIFRSREFEQMELEWFCAEEDVPMWFDFWVEQRRAFWLSLGLPKSELHFLDVDKADLAHYSSRTIDIEYRFPFAAPGFDELEGIAHRGNYDLTQHQEFSGQKLDYFDQAENKRFLPHVIEPSTGLTRGVLALICQAYTVDENRPSGVYLDFHPSMAPKKAAILPLTAKDKHVPTAQKLYLDLRDEFVVDLDIKQNIGKRYARQDEIGTPYCFTIDNETAEDHSVTVRDRNTMAQERIHLDKVKDFLREKINGRS